MGGARSGMLGVAAAVLFLACSGSSNGENPPGCPKGPPSDGATCVPTGIVCEYAGSPCGTTARCAGGSWQSQTTCPPPDECPAAQPTAGSPCQLTNPVAGELRCSFGSCPSGTLRGPEAIAICSGLEWEIDVRECRPAITCGECPPGRNCDAACEPGQGQPCGSNQCDEANLCLRTELRNGDWFWDCATNRCGTDPLDCGCLGTVCGQRGFPGDWTCTGVAGGVVTCECQGPDC